MDNTWVPRAPTHEYRSPEWERQDAGCGNSAADNARSSCPQCGPGSCHTHLHVSPGSRQTQLGRSDRSLSARCSHTAGIRGGPGHLRISRADRCRRVHSVRSWGRQCCAGRHRHHGPALQRRGQQRLQAEGRSGRRGRGRSSCLADAAGTRRSRRWVGSSLSGAPGPAW